MLLLCPADKFDLLKLKVDAGKHWGLDKKWGKKLLTKGEYNLLLLHTESDCGTTLTECRLHTLLLPVPGSTSTVELTGSGHDSVASCMAVQLPLLYHALMHTAPLAESAKPLPPTYTLQGSGLAVQWCQLASPLLHWLPAWQFKYIECSADVLVTGTEYYCD